MNISEVADKIYQARVQKKWTLEEVATRTGTTKQNISRYEKKKVKKPDFALLNKIFEELELDKSTLELVSGDVKHADKDEIIARQAAEIENLRKVLRDLL